MTLAIRGATEADLGAWTGLWNGFLAYYKVTLQPSVTAATWARIVDPDHRMTCRMAFEQDRALGFAIHHHHCSSWVPGDDVYLEDLFVAPEARGKGVGRALINDLIAIGRTNGWHRLYWNTDRTNTAARALYDSFCPDDDHIRYRLTL
ncbi:MAG: GNAT family N-acetyltransferase [Paracoccaceae bacterium]